MMISFSRFFFFFLKFLLFCHMVRAVPTALSASRNTPLPQAIPVHVTRSENGPDTFFPNKITPCNGLDYCSKAKAVMVEESKECSCRCPPESPVFQDDVGVCVPQIPESSECRFGVLTDGAREEINPTVQLPAFGHTITRKINLTFSESNSKRQCLALECQFLSTDGWSSFSTIRLGSQPPRLRLVQSQLPPFWQEEQPILNQSQSAKSAAATNSVVFNLQWLGSSEHADFLQGRLILLTTICNGTGLQPLNLCFPMRVAGTSGRLRSSTLLDAATVLQHDGDTVETGVLVAAACGGALGVLYLIVLAIFVASRLRKRRKAKHNTRQHIDGHDNLASNNNNQDKLAGPANVQPLGNSLTSSYNPSPYSAWSEEFAGRQQCLQPRGLSHSAAASLPMRYLCSPPPFFLNDVLIVQTPEALQRDTQIQDVIHKRMEDKALPKPPIRRRKVFFDPEYLSTDQLKNPPDAAENFRAQIHCMVNITKGRLDRRKFLPHLEMIDEENSLRRAMKETMIMGQLMQLTAEGATHLFLGELDRNPTRCGGPRGRDLDAVVLQVKRPADDPLDLSSPSSDPTTVARQSDWSQILKDEWGSNESLAKVPLRRRIQDVFQSNTADLGAKNSQPLSRASPTLQKAKMPHNFFLETGKGKTADGSVKVTSDDEESDKASSKSGTGSSPEKDSGIEDDVNSDKSNKTSSHKTSGKPADGLGMISRKKIVSASAAVGVTSLLPGRARAANVHPSTLLPAF